MKNDWINSIENKFRLREEALAAELLSVFLILDYPVQIWKIKQKQVNLMNGYLVISGIGMRASRPKIWRGLSRFFCVWRNECQCKKSSGIRGGGGARDNCISCLNRTNTNNNWGQCTLLLYSLILVLLYIVTT